MEESVKYFVPDISDIRVGYECEIKHSTEIHVLSHSHGGKEWNPITLKTDWDVWNIIHYVEHDSARVPYLTKEQIEKEGWELKGSKDYLLFGYNVMQNFHNAMEKGDYVIQGRSLFGSQHHLKIFDRSDQEGAMCIYEGICKDINTFRYICKLLGI